MTTTSMASLERPIVPNEPVTIRKILCEGWGFMTRQWKSPQQRHNSIVAVAVTPKMDANVLCKVPITVERAGETLTPSTRAGHRVGIINQWSNAEVMLSFDHFDDTQKGCVKSLAHVTVVGESERGTSKFVVMTKFYHRLSTILKCRLSSLSLHEYGMTPEESIQTIKSEWE